MFQYKMNIFEAGTYLLLSIEFSAYRIEIHLQQTWEFCLQIFVEFDILDTIGTPVAMMAQRRVKGKREGVGGTLKDFAAETKSTRLNKGQAAKFFVFRFHVKVCYVLRLSRDTWIWLCPPLV
jgi:hypothetical protein